MSPADGVPWFDRFFQHEYLSFDEHPHTEREIAFILEALDLSDNDSLLDLCCGYGRHSIPLARRGVRVLGLDRSPVMLDAAAAEAPDDLTLLRGDMSRLPFRTGVDAVISMFSSFGYFEDDDENFRVLKEISRVLKPGGRFLIETANREFVVRHFNPVQVYRPNDDVLIEERSFDVVSSRSHVDVLLISGGKQTRLHHTIRLYTVSELQMLLEAVGLIAEEVWGDFEGSAFTWDAPHMILQARKVA